MPWQWAGRTAGSLLAVIAAVLFLLQVGVQAADSAPRSCGSSWDVVAGRTGWQQWWAEDLADTSPPVQGTLVRTVECPAAVNQRTVISGSLIAAAVVLVGLGELAGRRHTRGSRERTRRSGRLRTLSTVLIVAGCLLTVAGLIGVALLVANPDNALFVYVPRPAVALVGSLLVIPAVFVAALGMAARAAADDIDDERGAGEGR